MDTTEKIDLDWVRAKCESNGLTRILEYFPLPQTGDDMSVYNKLLNELLISNRIIVATRDTKFDRLLAKLFEGKVVDLHGLFRGKGRGKKNMARLSLYDRNQHSVCITESPRRRIYGGTNRQIAWAILVTLDQCLLQSEEGEEGYLLMELKKLRNKARNRLAFMKADRKTLLMLSLRRYWRTGLVDPLTGSLVTSFDALLSRPVEELWWSPVSAVAAAVLSARIIDGECGLNVAQTASFFIRFWIKGKRPSGPWDGQKLGLLDAVAASFCKLLFPDRNTKRIDKILGEKTKIPSAIRKIARGVRRCVSMIAQTSDDEAHDTKKHLPKGIMFVETVSIPFETFLSKVSECVGPFRPVEFDDPVFFMLYRVPYNQLTFTIDHVVDELEDVVHNPRGLMHGYPAQDGSVFVVEREWLDIVRSVLLFLHGRVSSSRCSDDVPLFPIVAKMFFPIVGKNSVSELNSQERILLCLGARLLCCWFESNRSSRLMHALGSLANIDAKAVFWALKTIVHQWGSPSDLEKEEFYWPWIDWLRQTRCAVKEDADKVIKSRSIRDKYKDNVLSSVFELLRVGSQTDARLEWVDSAHQTLVKFLLCNRGDFISDEDEEEGEEWYENDWVWEDPDHIVSMQYILGVETGWMSRGERVWRSMALIPGTVMIRQRIWALIYDDRFPPPLRRYLLNRTQLKRTHEALDKRGTRFSNETLQAYNACLSHSATPFITKVPWTDDTVQTAIVIGRGYSIQADPTRPDRQGARRIDGPDKDSIKLGKMERKELVAAGAISASVSKTRWYAQRSKNQGSKQIKEYCMFNMEHTTTVSDTVLGSTERAEDLDDGFIVCGASQPTDVEYDEDDEEELMEIPEEDEEEDYTHSVQEEDMEGYIVDDDFFVVQADTRMEEEEEEEEEELLECVEEEREEGKDQAFAQSVYKKTGVDIEAQGMTMGLAAREILRGHWEEFLEHERASNEEGSCDWRLDLLGTNGISELSQLDPSDSKPDNERSTLVNLCLLCERAGIKRDRMERAWYQVDWNPALERDGFPVIIDKDDSVYSPRMYRNCLPVFRLHPRNTRLFGEAPSTLIPDFVENVFL
jgi:hypothetical protein